MKIWLICRVNFEVWFRIVSSCSSCPFVGLCPWMEWQMGWIWWEVLVCLLFLLFLSVLIIICTCWVLTFVCLRLSFCRYVALLVVSLVCYVATFGITGVLFHFFAPSGQDCGLNTFFIVVTLIFIFTFAIVTLHPSVSILDLVTCILNSILL